MEPTKRNPDGLISKKPIALRLMPDELDNAKRVSSEANISLSRLAREAFLIGLPMVMSNTPEKVETTDGNQSRTESESDCIHVVALKSA